MRFNTALGRRLWIMIHWEFISNNTELKRTKKNRSDPTATLFTSRSCSSFSFSAAGNEDDIDNVDPKKTDPEYFTHDCLTVDEVEKLLNESVEKLSNTLKITPSLAKVLLHEHKWDANDIVEKYRDNASNLLVSSRIKSGNGKKVAYVTLLCPVCIQTQPFDKFHNLSCAHSFCKVCILIIQLFIE